MTYNINDGLMGIQWGRGEWGISRCQVITRLSLHLFVGGGGGREGTEYNKVENF